MVASTGMVCKDKRNVCVTTHLPAKHSTDPPESGKSPRAKKESQMVHLCTEDLWKEQLISLGWSKHAATQIQFCRAKSTMGHYKHIVAKFMCFCQDRGPSLLHQRILLFLLIFYVSHVTVSQTIVNIEECISCIGMFV